MTIDHDRFAEANQPPPARVAETPEVEAGPEVEPCRPVEGAANVGGVAVACRLDGDTVHVTVLLPGRLESISTTVHVRPEPEPDDSYRGRFLAIMRECGVATSPDLLLSSGVRLDALGEMVGLRRGGLRVPGAHR